MRAPLDVIQAITGLRPDMMEKGEAIDVDIAQRRIVVRRKGGAVHEFTIPESCLADLRGAVEAKGQGRAGWIEKVMLVLTVIQVWFMASEKCWTTRKTTTYRETETLPDGREKITEWTVDEDETQCEPLPDPQPDPLPQGDPSATSDCCQMCGEQLIAGKKHYCK